MDAALFDRRFFEQRRSRIGSGAVGGKAQGLLMAAEILDRERAEMDVPGIAVEIPALTVVAAGAFDAFVDRNGLRELIRAEDLADERIVHAVRRADLPAEIVGDLRALAHEVRAPLAVRSSSALEDALGQPFAGVYGTKMVPGNQPDADSRFRSLVDAIKFVYASTFFHGARAYMRAIDRRLEEERMAVLVQEVVGRRHGDRFYPEISGVARSYNFYPTGGAEPGEGVVSLALGLGKTIVDGGLCWSFSPAHPRTGPPFASVQDMLEKTQAEFWAVNIGPPPAYDPMAETEYLVKAGLAEAEADGTLRHLASTYDPRSDRLTPGTARPGPRVLDFAPLLVLEELPLVAQLRKLMAGAEDALGAPVEIEFALSPSVGGAPARLGFLQVRPLVVGREAVKVTLEDLVSERAIVASTAALGNGTAEGIRDVVFVDPDSFEARLTPAIAAELERINRGLLGEGRPYLLIGFGRWGSSDPWLGIPVRWDQIAGAKAIVEATLPQMSPDPSQGSHFFHNLSSFEIRYFTVRHGEGRGIDWDWLRRQPAVTRTDHVRHVRPPAPLSLKVDGRTRRGVVLRPA